MESLNVICPNCGGKQQVQQGDGIFKCQVCSYVYRLSCLGCGCTKWLMRLGESVENEPVGLVFEGIYRCTNCGCRFKNRRLIKPYPHLIFTDESEKFVFERRFGSIENYLAQSKPNQLVQTIIDMPRPVRKV